MFSMRVHLDLWLYKYGIIDNTSKLQIFTARVQQRNYEHVLVDVIHICVLFVFVAERSLFETPNDPCFQQIQCTAIILCKQCHVIHMFGQSVSQFVDAVVLIDGFDCFGEWSSVLHVQALLSLSHSTTPTRNTWHLRFRRRGWPSCEMDDPVWGRQQGGTRNRVNWNNLNMY